MYNKQAERRRITRHAARADPRIKDREARSHAGSSSTRPRCKARQTKQTHNTRSDERTKDTVLKILKHATNPCKHATNQIAANMHMRRYRRYQRTQESRRRKRHANEHPRDHAHAHTAETLTIAKTQHANWQTKLPSPPPPTHTKSCVITQNPNPSQRQHAYANETTHDRRFIGAYAPDPP